VAENDVQTNAPSNLRSLLEMYCPPGNEAAQTGTSSVHTGKKLERMFVQTGDFKNNRESPFLSGGSASMWHHRVISGGRADKPVTRAGRNKELQKLGGHISEDTVPGNSGDPIMHRS